MSDFFIAQVNIAQLIAPEGSAEVAEFFANVPRINELAEASPGYVWRYDGDYDDPLVAFNLSVWESIEHLSSFAYRSAHVEIFRRRHEWMRPINTAQLALWWVTPGTRPDAAEGMRRLALLNENGSSAEAFTFSEPFAKPSEKHQLT